MTRRTLEIVAGLAGMLGATGIAGAAAPPAASSALSPPVLAACTKVATCRPACEGVPADGDAPVYAPVGEFPGSFSAPGAEETIVSLFPCGEAFSRRQEGLTALARKEGARWTAVSTIEDAFDQDDCRRVDAGGRQRLVCQASVGPEQGVVTDALCVVSVQDGVLAHTCPLRVTDVTGFGCLADHERPGPRHTWAAAIRSWTPATVAGSPGVSLEVSVAALAVPAGDDLDAACEQAIKRLEKAPRESLTLELAFDQRGMTLTPASRKTASRFPWAIEGDE